MSGRRLRQNPYCHGLPAHVRPASCVQILFFLLLFGGCAHHGEFLRPSERQGVAGKSWVDLIRMSDDCLRESMRLRKRADEIRTEMLDNARKESIQQAGGLAIYIFATCLASGDRHCAMTYLDVMSRYNASPDMVALFRRLLSEVDCEFTRPDLAAVAKSMLARDEYIDGLYAYLALALWDEDRETATALLQRSTEKGEKAISCVQCGSGIFCKIGQPPIHMVIDKCR